MSSHATAVELPLVFGGAIRKNFEGALAHLKERLEASPTS
jgi:hypothetical protein